MHCLARMTLTAFLGLCVGGKVQDSRRLGGAVLAGSEGEIEEGRVVSGGSTLVSEPLEGCLGDSFAFSC